jgi:RND superfamily putative drug exporter
VSQIVVAPVQGPDSDATHALVRSLRAELPGVLAPGTTALVTGSTAGGVDFEDVLIDSLPAIWGAVALTLILLRRAFGSWLLPLLALVLNAMVVAASIGLTTLVSQDGLGRPVDSITPTLVFAIIFGLSMDYMVIMVSRMREWAIEYGDHREAVMHGVRRSAGMVNGAALIMLAVFVSFLSAKISVVQQLGIALSIAVILDAVVIRLVVMPSALLLMGPRVWGRLPARQPDILPASAPLNHQVADPQ